MDAAYKVSAKIVKSMKNTRVASSMYAQLMSSLNHQGSNFSQYFQDTVKFLDVQKAAGINPYPHKFSVTMTITDFIENYAALKIGEGLEDKDQVSLAGRIMRKRPSSSKLIFYDVHGGGATIQVVFDASACQLEEAEVTKFHSSVNCFDIVGITGFPGKTNRGELSIFVKSVNSFVVLSHCLHELPIRSVKKGQVWAPGNIRNPDVYTLNDVETRYSQRFLDLILNEEVREVFKMRSKVIMYIRKFLDNLNFLEVETPIMSPNSGGAHLFITHHNELNMKLCMRSTPDVFLKQLVVGGLDRVYEIGKQFSNEAIDDSHNPEFTTCKLYRAYADYNDMIELTENLLSGMVKELTGRYVIKCQFNGIDKAPVDIDFRPPFRKINVIRELEKVANISIPSDLASEEANRHLMDACAKYGVHCTPPHTTVRLLNKLVSHFLEQTCVNPTFIMDHPDMINPLAKCHRSKPGLTEYFELFVNKHMLCKGCTEINDPLLQHQQSSDPRSGKRAVDLDDSCCTAQACTEINDPLLQQQSSDPQSSKGALDLNDSCCTALEYGLPPSASWDLSIDNLAMLLTDSQRMQEVLLFPAMKPHVEPHCHESPLPSFFRIAVVGDTHEDWALLEDSIALHFLQPDLVMFTGDFGNENAELVKSVSQLNFPKVAILGNHDSWTTSKFKKVKDGVQLQLEYLGEAHVGYNNVDFPTLNLSVVGGRPFSCGGNQLFRNKLLKARYGVHSMEESAERIYNVARRTPKDNSIILLAHNGPEGLGSTKDDICGLDFKSGAGDFGDPDLAQAIKQLKETTSYRIPLVVFGHMHKELKCGESRKMIAFGADDTMYLNAAIVPRVKYFNARCSSRAFTVVEFSDGKITKVTEIWVSIIDDKASLEEEHLLYSNGFENETNS